MRDTKRPRSVALDSRPTLAPWPVVSLLPGAVALAVWCVISF